MWKELALFELKTQLKSPLFAVSSGVFFLFALALASSDLAFAGGGIPGTTWRNAPLVVISAMPVLSLLGLFVITAFVAGAALRDFEQRSDMLFFTKPLRSIDYLGGRFLGAMGVSFLVMLVAVVGLGLGNFVPWQAPEQLGPVHFGPYVFGLLVIIVPNLWIMGGLFFALAIWSRRLSLTFLGVVFFIGMQDVLEIVAQGLDHRWLGSLLEPSGVVAIESLSRYWTMAEKNSRGLQLGGVLLANRLLWSALAFALWSLAVRRFEPAASQFKAGKIKSSQRPSRLPIDAQGPAVAEESLLRTSKSASRDDSSRKQDSPRRYRWPRNWRKNWRSLWLQTHLEVSEVLPRAPFLCLLGFGLMIVVAFGLQVGMQGGMPSFPLTHFMLRAIGLGAQMTLLLILVYYAGELVFSQRSLNIAGIYDALPVPSWIYLWAKLLALGVLTAVFLAAASVATLGLQVSKGFFQFEPLLLLQGLLIIAWPLLLLAVLALFLQVLTDSKMLGLLLTTVVCVARYALPRLGWENNLYLYGAHPPIRYSGVDGWGHQLEPFLVFMAYWSCGALLLLMLSRRLWSRGIQEPLKQRLLRLRQGLNLQTAVGLALPLLAMGVTGGWIHANTFGSKAPNPGESFDRDGILERQAAYETLYSDYRDVPLPLITSVFAEVDLYPRQRRAQIRGRYRLQNPHDEPLSVVPISRSPNWVEGVLPVYGGVVFERLDLPSSRRLVDDKRLGFYVLEMAQPLLPGQTLDLDFTVEVDHRAFANRRHNFLLVDNGTFFSNRSFFPVLGYAASQEIQSPQDRRGRGLPALRRVADLDDVGARQHNYLAADWIDFEAIVSTDADQVAIAPGRLLKQWSEKDRRFFHYATRRPVVNLLPFLSGRYEVLRDRWQGVDIEVYFHPDHGANIERFIEVTKRTLEHMTATLGPYPHPQLRIVEIPSYHGEVAFSFAQTIAYSELWSFNADLEKAEMDWLTAILAHEVAHQWWNHQVVPADVQGATLIAESLCQYAAMSLLHELHGPDMVRRFLAFHLDQYLTGRGRAEVAELPLARVENQDYVHYSKAILMFYALEDLIGREPLRGALRDLFEAQAFAGPPFSTSRDLLAHLRRATPPEAKASLDDLFNTVGIDSYHPFIDRDASNTLRPLAPTHPGSQPSTSQGSNDHVDD